MSLIRKKVLIISISRLHRDPRVLRQIFFLRDDYEISAMGLTDPEQEGATFIPCWKTKKRPTRPVIKKCNVPEPLWYRLGFGFLSQQVSLLDLFLPRMKLFRYLTYRFGLWDELYEKKYWTSAYNRKAKEHLDKNRYDFILANDINTLPLAVSCANGAKVIFDSHEYAPLQSHSWDYRLSTKPVVHYQLKRYGPNVDAMVTVSPGFIDRFKREYGLTCEVMTNAPFNEDIKPSSVEKNRIRMVHHGFASPQRKTIEMVELMSYLDERFELDFMLIDSNRSYVDNMKKKAKDNPKIRFVSPVPTMEIARTINKYDVGLYALYPTCYNAEQCLPNKFFEFINASLALAVTPVEQMAKLIKEYRMGVVGKNMSLRSLANELNALDDNRLREMKEAAYEASKELNAQKNGEMFRRILSRVENEGSPLK